MNLIGQRFGRLEVVEADAVRKGYVICKCDCGNTKSIRATQLTQTRCPTRSCGCIQRELISGTGRATSKKNFGQFHEESRQYRTNFHVIESDKPNRNTKSGHKGVWYDEKRGLWEAYISIHRKRIHLGRYGKKEDAVQARKLAEEQYFAPLIQKKRSVINVGLGQQDES